MLKGAADQEADASLRKQMSDVLGLELGALLGRDAFCSVWVAKPLDEGFPDTCVKVIPPGVLGVAEAGRRLAAEVQFWKELPEELAVPLYQAGLRQDHLFLLMRYEAGRSLAQQSDPDSALRAAPAQFAAEFAALLADYHSRAGAHGNLKPTNVFRLREGPLLLSDFALPLWLDAFAAGCPALAPHVLHPYRAPEQRDDPRDYDTRSDVYSFGLIMLYILSGKGPRADGHPPDTERLEWPQGLKRVVDKCLAPDPSDRLPDGTAVFDALEESTHVIPQRRPGSSWEVPAPQSAAGAQPGEADEVLDRARALAAEGRLEEAVVALESLPAGTPGLEEVLDQVEQRQRAAEKLVEEAIRLASTGHVDGAVETVERAERLHPNSATVIATKAELMAEAERSRARPAGEVPEALEAALEVGKYAVARSMIEKLIRDEPVTPALQEVIRRFKQGRVRQAFLDHLRTARRLYVLGHRTEAAQHWLEAGRWLPSGAEREQLRLIAGAAEKGVLEVEAEQAEPTPAAEPGVLAEEARPAPEPAALPDVAPQAVPPRDRFLPLVLALIGLLLLLGGAVALVRKLTGR
jgi:tetratricopeptide (TPR) repeat protein